MAIFKTKIGFNRGRRRIWIDGKRLTWAGFHGGSRYVLTQNAGSLTLTAVGTDVDDAKDIAAKVEGQARKVTGRPDGKPIIDIIGKTVSETFGADVTHVIVTTKPCEIHITPDV